MNQKADPSKEDQAFHEHLQKPISVGHRSGVQSASRRRLRAEPRAPGIVIHTGVDSLIFTAGGPGERRFPCH